MVGPASRLGGVRRAEPDPGGGGGGASAAQLAPSVSHPRSVADHKAVPLLLGNELESSQAGACSAGGVGGAGRCRTWSRARQALAPNPPTLPPLTLTIVVCARPAAGGGGVDRHPQRCRLGGRCARPRNKALRQGGARALRRAQRTHAHGAPAVQGLSGEGRGACARCTHIVLGDHHPGAVLAVAGKGKGGARGGRDKRRREGARASPQPPNPTRPPQGGDTSAGWVGSSAGSAGTQTRCVLGHLLRFLQIHRSSKSTATARRSAHKSHTPTSPCASAERGPSRRRGGGPPCSVIQATHCQSPARQEGLVPRTLQTAR